jgi:hypothetical protein
MRTALAAGLVALLAGACPAGAASYTWGVAGGNWSAPTSWTPNTTGPNGPLAADTAIFGSGFTTASPATVNNIVDSGFAGTISNLTYNSTYNSAGTAAYNVTQIGAGQTLRVTGTLLVGGANGGNTNLTTQAYFTGGGALAISKGSLMVQNYDNSGSGGNSMAYLNLSGLSTFVYSNALGTISVADNPGSNTRLGGTVFLAGVSNFITATNINLGTSTSAQAGPMGDLTLGPGTNIINVGTLSVANNKCSFAISNSGGGLQIRGVSGAATSRANITIGNRNVASSTGATTGQMLLNGCAVNILAATLTVGEAPNTAGPSGTAGLSGNGVLQFDTGVIDATNMVMAYNSSPSAAGGLAAASSAVTVGANAVLRIGAGGLSLLNQTASNICSSTLTISNGIVICNGNITVATNAADGTGTYATSTAGETNVINIIGAGTLVLGPGCTAGTVSVPIGQLNLDVNSSLQYTTPPANNQAAIAVNTLVWPANDSALTFVVSNLPPTATVGTVLPLLHFNAFTGGAFTAPVAVLPTGVTGNLSVSGNSIVLTITSSTYPYFSPLSFTPATLCTNKAVTFTAASLVSTIANVQVVALTNTLGGLTNVYTTNNVGSAGLTVSGLGTATANITYALATNTVYNSLMVKVTDANGLSVTLPVGAFDTLAPALVFEAADFNYSSGQFIDTPPDGGVALYFNQVGVPGVDENKAARAGTKSYYRTNDAVVIQAANPVSPSLTEQKFVIAAADGDTVDTEQEVGYNSGGDWLNYSRTFGPGGSAPAGTYNVWCYLATSGSGVQLAFSQVTSDSTQGSQMTNILGSFGSAAFSDNSYNNYVYVPLLDQFGNRVALTVTNGVQTFKSTVVGNPNIAFYMLTPVAPVLTPQVLNVNPNGSVPFAATNSLTFTVGPAQGASVAASGIGLTLNGVTVSTGLVLSEVGGVWTATYAIPSNEVYTATINVTNTAGLSTTVTISFDTFNANNFQWEAVDYDFSTNNGTGVGGTAGGGWYGGQFIDNPVPSGDTNEVPNNGTLQPNSYWSWPTGWTVGNDGYGAIAQQSVDIYWPTNATQGQGNANAAYRNPDLVGSQVATDFLRYKFLLAQTNLSDPAICQYNIGYFYASNWMNYTRTYPAGRFNIWARLAGGNGAFSGATLSQVTSGVGTSNQTTQVLGTFADPSPAGWQAYHTLPMLDTNGDMAVVQLGGVATLRFTAPTNATPSAGGLNALYFMLTPAEAAAEFRVSASYAGNQLSIAIPTQIGHNYSVWYSSSLQPANWTLVTSGITGNGGIQTITPAGGGSQGYYRVLAQ